MIVRISGLQAFRIVSESLLAGEIISEPKVERRSIAVGGSTCPCWVYTMRGPRSATGEDTVELHIPGNPILAKMIMDSVLAAGASAAEPGAFTARAFFNRKLDLAAAEGVAAVISAQNQLQLAAARQLADGELSRRLRPIMDRLVNTLSLLETGLDFSEEDITVLDRGELLRRVEDVQQLLHELIASSGRFASLPHEPVIVLYGRANAGKSALLNALARDHRAIVSARAGTTRDALSTNIRLPRGFAKLIDVAGVDDAEEQSEITAAAAELAWRTASEADVLVLVRDITDVRADPVLPVPAHIVVYSKSDLVVSQAEDGKLRVSAVNGAGIERLKNRLDELTFESSRDQTLLLNSRHEQAIAASRAALDRVCEAEHDSAEIDAMELRESVDAIGSIIGVVTPDDVLGKIFSTFCIGK